MSTTHGFVIDSLAKIIEAHYNNYVLYKQDYHSNIDSALHARILQDELTDINAYMQVSLTGTVDVDEAIKTALAEVSDLFQPGFPGAQPVEDANQDIQERLVKLDEDITNLENNHQNTDFSEIAELIASLTAFINGQISNGRSYKSTFTVESLQNNSALMRLGEAYNALGDAQEAKSAALVQAFEDEQVRQDLLREEREREAAAVNWAVTGLCIVASIGVIVLSGGTAAPAVVVATSAATQALSSATQEATAQYVEKGNMSLIDWDDVGEEAFWGGVSGAVTGTMGYYGGELISRGFQHFKPVANLMNANSRVVRVASNGTIQGINEVGAGVATRFVGEGISNGGDWGAALEVAANRTSMLIDFGIGFATGGVKGLKSRPAATDMTLSEEIDEILRKVEDGEIELENTLQKGNYGEMKVDRHLENQGYERLGSPEDRVLGLDAKTHQGIDGVYYKPDGKPPYLIVESKYGTSRLSKLRDRTTRQMSASWIHNGGRLEKIVGPDLARELDLSRLSGNRLYESVLMNVNQNGEIKAFVLDDAANKVGEWIAKR